MRSYPCAQNIATMMSWQIQTNSTFGGLSKYSDFVRWYYKCEDSPAQLLLLLGPFAVQPQ